MMEAGLGRRHRPRHVKGLSCIYLDSLAFSLLQHQTKYYILLVVAYLAHATCSYILGYEFW